MLDGFVEYGYIGLFIASFLAATILPFGSEFVFAGLLAMGLNAWGCVIVASVGNWLGGMTNYFLGRLGKVEWIEKYLKVDRGKIDKMQKWLEGKGAIMAFFSFMPIVGDIIALALGFMRANVYIVNIAMFAGKLLRYVLIMYGVGWIFLSPHSVPDKDKQSSDIEWKKELQGDFSFTEEWSYPENIFKNEYGQLVCDGFCEPELDKMRDESGKIIDDSITRYYQLVDTTHYHHTISSEAKSYEWIGTDFADAYEADNDTIKCKTRCGVATHSSLQLSIIGDMCIPQIELNSVSMSGVQHFKYKSGSIKIDKPLFEKGILKAEFDYTFDDPTDPKNPLWWKGRIYTTIKEKENI